MEIISNAAKLNGVDQFFWLRGLCLIAVAVAVDSQEGAGLRWLKLDLFAQLDNVLVKGARGALIVYPDRLW